MDEFCREVHIEDGKDPIMCLEQELGKLGKDVGSPVPAEMGSSKEVYRLRCWSSRWECYIDVIDSSQIADGDVLYHTCMVHTMIRVYAYGIAICVWYGLLYHTRMVPVADLGGVPRVPWNPPFGFSDDRRLWKPGL